jgi:hypothetical protein
MLTECELYNIDDSHSSASSYLLFVCNLVICFEFNEFLFVADFTCLVFKYVIMHGCMYSIPYICICTIYVHSHTHSRKNCFKTADNFQYSHRKHFFNWIAVYRIAFLTVKALHCPKVATQFTDVIRCFPSYDFISASS